MLDGHFGNLKGISAVRFLPKGADSGISPLKNGKRADSLRLPTLGIGPSLPRGSGPPPRRPRVGRLFARVAEEAEEQLLERVGAVAAAAVAAAVCRGQLCKNRSSRKIDSRRLFSGE